MNKLTHFIQTWADTFFLITIPLLVLLWMVIIYTMVKKNTYHHKEYTWTAVKLPLTIALVSIFIALNYYLLLEFFGLGGTFTQQMIINTLIKILICFIIGATIFGILLWHKNKFSWYLIRRFTIGFVLGFLLFTVIIVSLHLIMILLLRTDPHVRLLEEKIKEYHQQQLVS